MSGEPGCHLDGTRHSRGAGGGAVGLLRVLEPAGRCWLGGQLRRVAAEAVLRAESYKHLAPPRNTNNKQYLQSTQTTINRHNSQTKQPAPSKDQPKIRVAKHYPAQQPPSIDTQTQQGHRQSCLSERSPLHRGAGAHYNTAITRTSGDTQNPSWGARYQVELVDSPGAVSRLAHGRLQLRPLGMAAKE